MAGRHHQCNEHELGHTLGECEGLGAVHVTGISYDQVPEQHCNYRKPACSSRLSAAINNKIKLRKKAKPSTDESKNS